MFKVWTCQRWGGILAPSRILCRFETAELGNIYMDAGLPHSGRVDFWEADRCR
jgi:hypothetical protein